MGTLNIEFSINQKIEILDKNMTFKSSIQDIQESYYAISIPMAGTKVFVMHAGTELNFYINTNNEIYKCRSNVLGKKEDNNLQLIIISRPEVIKKVQRREYFRLPIAMEAKYCLLPQSRQYLNLKDIPPGYFNYMTKCITIDISGGGMKIAAKEFARESCNALVKLQLSEEICLLCTIVRTEYNEIDKNYRISLKFGKMEERVRDKIIKFIFSKMREQTKVLR